MRAGVDESIFLRFPEYTRAVVVARNVDNQLQEAQIEVLLRKSEQEARALFGQENLTTYPGILSWREAYKALGLRPSSFYCSVEALARRARRGRPVPYINTLVAVMNGFSLKHLVPCGGDDIDKVTGNVTLRFARGDERFVPFNGHSLQPLRPNEVIYVDDVGTVICRHWNWRQGNQSKITPNTRNALLNVDCLPPVGIEKAPGLIEELAGLVRRYCGAQVSQHIIHRENPWIDV